jgi:crotonobetainyl-CoA:carnitine CoA-transferase CaiB-like acyl-CoA transferase
MTATDADVIPVLRSGLNRLAASFIGRLIEATTATDQQHAAKLLREADAICEALNEVDDRIYEIEQDCDYD